MFAASNYVKVRYSDTFGMGCVYHGNYYKWFEDVQIDFLKKHQISIEEMSRETRLLPIDMQCKYLTPAHNGDELEVGMCVDEVTSIKVTVSYTITRVGDFAKIAKCKGVYACVDRAYRPLLIQNAVPKLHNAFLQAMRDQG